MKDSQNQKQEKRAPQCKPSMQKIQQTQADPPPPNRKPRDSQETIARPPARQRRDAEEDPATMSKNKIKTTTTRNSQATPNAEPPTPSHTRRPAQPPHTHNQYDCGAQDHLRPQISEVATDMGYSYPTI